MLHHPELPTGARLQEAFCCFIDTLGGETPTDWEVLEPTKTHVRFFSKEARMEEAEPVRVHLS